MTGTRFLDRVNPVTPFAAAVLYTVPMLTTIDAVSAATALGLVAVFFVLQRIGPVTVLRRSWPLLLAAPVSALSMLLYAKPGGRVHGQFWLATITDNSIELSLATALRVLAVGMPTLVLLVGVDPTRLADGLAQVAKLPARFVLGALAGIRLFAVFTDDWSALARARRARGLGDSGAIRRGLTMAFALLVTALRRGGALATAMEARGFGHGPRTWARESTTSWRDPVLLVIALATGLASISVAIGTGAFRLVGS